jgi:hypothetical protein
VKLRKYSDNQLREAVKKSASMRQALQILDVAPYGGNYDVLRKAIRYFNLDTSHFVGQAWNKGKILPPKQPLEKYLSNSLPFSRISSEIDCCEKAFLSIAVPVAGIHDGSISLSLWSLTTSTETTRTTG